MILVEDWAEPPRGLQGLGELHTDRWGHTVPSAHVATASCRPVK